MADSTCSTSTCPTSFPSAFFTSEEEKSNIELEGNIAVSNLCGHKYWDTSCLQRSDVLLRRTQTSITQRVPVSSGSDRLGSGAVFLTLDSKSTSTLEIGLFYAIWFYGSHGSGPEKTEVFSQFCEPWSVVVSLLVWLIMENPGSGPAEYWNQFSCSTVSGSWKQEPGLRLGLSGPGLCRINRTWFVIRLQ